MQMVCCRHKPLFLTSNALNSAHYCRLQWMHMESGTPGSGYGMPNLKQGRGAEAGLSTGEPAKHLWTLLYLLQR